MNRPRRACQAKASSTKSNSKVTDRKRTKPADEAPSSKRHKDSIEDDLVCPITLALPFEPVVAEDGRVYERSAIQDHITNNQGGALKSPITMEPMGDRLVQAIQHKNIIETSIRNGTITGDLAANWKEKEQQEKDRKELVKEAEGGDIDAMEKVAMGYDEGQSGFKQDEKKAYTWYQKAHAAGSVLGMAKQGEFLVEGIGGIERDRPKGMMYLGMAEGRGLDVAAFLLGWYFADGEYEFPVDKVLAQHMLEKSLRADCPIQHMGPTAKQEAQQKLNEILQETAD